MHSPKHTASCKIQGKHRKTKAEKIRADDQLDLKTILSAKFN